MPSSISPLNQALSLLKVQLNQARVSGHRKQAPSVASAQAEFASQAPAAALQALRTQVRNARGRDGKLEPRKALRLFVQAALVDELGAELQLDPALNDLVERTCQALEQDSANAAILADALRDLEKLAD